MPQAPKPRKEAFSRNPKQQGTPLYSEVTTFGDLVFVSGHGVATHGDVKAQTTEVLNQIAAALQKAGSSMNQVMKCNVYLKTLDDYKAMNEAFHGRFGDAPPVRTTVAVSGIPLEGCLVEIDVIAHR
jgi:enamine deaminase RidA (YjgF/YER057c/UK114 family)